LPGIGVLSALSVITSQFLNYKASPSGPTFIESIQWREVIIMMIIGASFITPALLIFYHFLNKLTIGGSLGKLIVDQVIFAPMFNCSIIALRFFLLDSNLSCADILNLVKTIGPTAIKSAWLFWIPQRYFSLNYVPGMYQLVFGNLCSYVWNILFSMIMSSAN
jgi:hypothetical protein